MKTDRYTHAELTEGETRLKIILRTFKEIGLTGQPPFGAQLSDAWHHYGPHNMKAFFVTNRNGGWVADVVLHKAPEGCGDVLGTPECCPFPTFEEAFEAGLLVLCALISGTQSTAPLPS